MDSSALQLAPIVVTTVGTCFLALLVYKNNPKSATNVLFALLSFTLVIWAISNYLSVSGQLLESSLLLIRLSIFFASPMSVLFFLFAHTMPHHRITLKRWQVGSIVIVTLLTMVLALSPYTFTSVVFIDNEPLPSAGPGMLVFSLVTTFFSVIAILTLIRKYSQSQAMERQQYLYVMAGIVIMLGLVITTVLIPVLLWQISFFVSFIPLYTLIFLAMTTYAILRHQLLDVRFIAARAVSYTLAISLFGIAYALIFSLTSSLLVTPFIEPKFVGVSTLAAVFMLLTFPGAKRLIEKATDTLFFKNKYDAQEVLFRLTNIMARTLRLEDVTHQFLSQLNREMHIQKSAIIITDNDHIFSTITEGYATPPELPETEVMLVAKHTKIQQRDIEPDPEAKMLLEAMDGSIVIPLTTSQRLIGLLVIGAKLSGEMYTSEDMNMLSIIAPEVAVSIENALSYEEIHRFNITLEDEITHATEDLRAANTKLQELDKLKDEFVSLASHELRTPLTSIRSYLWLTLSGKGGELSEKQRNYLDRSFVSTNRLIRLVNDMLNISRIESGRIAVQLSRVNMATLVKDVVGEVQPKLDEQGLKLQQSILIDVPDVIADTDKIKEVLINFIGNAIKFTPKGGFISITIGVEGQWVRVNITDSGIGFLPGESDKLFRKFSTLSHSSQSTGLGLYISKSIISMHGGTVYATSGGVGKGSTFSFMLPVYSASKREELQRKFTYDGLGIIHSTIE